MGGKELVDGKIYGMSRWSGNRLEKDVSGENLANAIGDSNYDQELRRKKLPRREDEKRLVNLRRGPPQTLKNGGGKEIFSYARGQTAQKR